MTLTTDSSLFLPVRPGGLGAEVLCCVTSVSPKQSAIHRSCFSARVAKDSLPYKPCAWNNLVSWFNIWQLATLPGQRLGSPFLAHLTCCLSLTGYRLLSLHTSFSPSSSKKRSDKEGCLFLQSCPKCFYPQTLNLPPEAFMSILWKRLKWACGSI